MKRFVILACIALLVAPACAPEPTATGTVVVSVPPLGSLVRMVAGERIPVLSFLPPGRSPHDFEPAPSQVERIQGAGLLVYVGGHVDPWMERMAASVQAKHTVVMSELVSGVSDPHLWLDLDAARALLPAVAEALAEGRPDQAEAFRERAREAVARLDQLDGALELRLRPVKHVPFALHHPAFLNLFRRYGMEPTAVLQEHSDGDISPQSLGRTVDALREAGAKVVFSQPEFNRRLADAVAMEIGGEVVLLDAMGEQLAPRGADYVDLLSWNAERIKEALGGAGH